jgi:hypothetical protein
MEYRKVSRRCVPCRQPPPQEPTHCRLRHVRSGFWHGLLQEWGVRSSEPGSRMAPALSSTYLIFGPRLPGTVCPNSCPKDRGSASNPSGISAGYVISGPPWDLSEAPPSGHSDTTRTPLGVRVYVSCPKRSSLVRQGQEPPIFGWELRARHLSDEGVQLTWVPIVSDPAL